MALSRPKSVPLFFKQGETVRLQFELTRNDIAVDINGWSFAAEIRIAQSAEVDLLATFDVAVVGDEEDGVVELSLADTVTAKLDAGLYFWDFTWTTDSGEVRVPIEGTVEVISRVTA